MRRRQEMLPRGPPEKCFLWVRAFEDFRNHCSIAVVSNFLRLTEFRGCLGKLHGVPEVLARRSVGPMETEEFFITDPMNPAWPIQLTTFLTNKLSF